MSQSAIDQDRPVWTKCSGCERLLYARKQERNLNVCPECGHHERLTAADRLAQLLDADSFTALPVRAAPDDVLGFVDSRPYPQRLAAARDATGLDEAVVVGTGRVGGITVGVAVMDFRFLGGSLGAGTGELIARAVDHATDIAAPVVIVTASGGARMQEGTLSLMQMATVSQSLSRHRAAGLLSLSVITDPTYGGVAASFATNVDIIIAERGARMGFAGPRVIAQTVKVDLPAGFQTADFLLEKGHIDLIAERRDLRDTLIRLLGATRPVLRLAETAPAPAQPIGPPADSSAAIATARDIGRPTFLDYIGMLADDFVELHGDRTSADCPALVAGLGRLRARPVLFLGHQRGHSTAELVARSFGMPMPAGYRKATRLLRLAGRLGLPVVALVDTPGAHPGPDSEQANQAGAIAECIQALGETPTPVVSVITGEGGSGGALALAVADRVLMLENAIYSVISPEGCAAILWGTAAQSGRAAEALRVTATEQRALGVIDDIVPEPKGGAQADPQRMGKLLADALTAVLDAHAGVPADELIGARRERFRRLAASRITQES